MSELRIAQPSCDIDFAWPAVYEADMAYRGWVRLCARCWRIYTDGKLGPTNRRLDVDEPTVRTTVISSRHIEACPSHSLSPRHYRDDGTCLHDEELVP